MSRLAALLLAAFALGGAQSATACSLMRVFDELTPWQAAQWALGSAVDTAADERPGIAFLGKVVSYSSPTGSEERRRGYGDQPVDLVRWEVIESYQEPVSGHLEAFAPGDGPCWNAPLVPGPGNLALMRATPIDGSERYDSYSIATGVQLYAARAAYLDQLYLIALLFPHTMILEAIDGITFELDYGAPPSLIRILFFARFSADLTFKQLEWTLQTAIVEPLIDRIY